jgi:hypothetical protein
MAAKDIENIPLVKITTLEEINKLTKFIYKAIEQIRVSIQDLEDQ